MTGVEKFFNTRIELACRPGEIERRRYRRGALHYRVCSVTFLAKPFEQHVAAERNAHYVNFARRKLFFQSPQHPVDLARVAGMIRARQPVGFAAAAAKVRHHAAPAALGRRTHQTERVMTSRVAFEAVE